MKRTQLVAPTIAVMVLLVAITMGLWTFHQWRLANFTRTKLSEEYHVVSSPSQINIVQIKELGFWYDDFNLFAYHVWEVDFTKPNNPSYGFYFCTVNEPHFGEFENVEMVNTGVILNSSMNRTQSPMNFTGAVLGWDHTLYKLTSSISARNIGKKLGIATYHGRISEVFTIYQLLGDNPTDAIVFESEDGFYYKAVVTKSNP